VLPVIYVAFFAAAVFWWAFVFDPSEGRHPRLFLAAFWTVFAAHISVLLLMAGLAIYFLSGRRAASASPAEKVVWPVTLVFFNFLTYPLFYFFYIRPRLKYDAVVT
jgi:hypothetical protein